MKRGVAMILAVAALLALTAAAGAQEHGVQVVRIVSEPGGRARAYLRPTDDALKQWLTAAGNLTPANLTVGLLGGARATVSAVKRMPDAGEGVSTVIAIDRSGSFKKKARFAEQAVFEYLDGMGPSDYTAIVAFSERNFVLPFTQSKADIQTFVGDLGDELDKYTHLYNALKEALEQAKRAPTDFVVVLAFTDGEDETLVDERLLQQEYLAAKVPLYALVEQRSSPKPGARSARVRFQNLATNTKGQTELLSSLEDLSAAFRRVREDHRGLIVVDFTACGVGATSATVSADFTFAGGSKKIAWTDVVEFQRHTNFGTGSCQCAADTDCAQPTPKCQVTSGQCVACLADGDCDGSKSLVCDQTAYRCVSDPGEIARLCKALQDGKVATLLCDVKGAAGENLAKPWSQSAATVCANQKLDDLPLDQGYKGSATLTCRMEAADGSAVAQSSGTVAVEPGVARTAVLDWTLGSEKVKTAVNVVAPGPCAPACEAWQTCAGGACQPTPCQDDAPCNGGLCQGGLCGPAVSCAPACDACQQCAPSGTCQPRPCQADTDCGGDCGCEKGACVEKDNSALIYGSMAAGAILLALLAALLLRWRSRQPEETVAAPAPPVEPAAGPPVTDVSQELAVSNGGPPLARNKRATETERAFVQPEPDGPAKARNSTDFSLVVVGGRLPAGQRFILREETLVGADRERATLLLDLPKLSGLHARIQVFPKGTVFVQDLGSLNGTMVREVKLFEGQREQVYPGDIIAFSSDVEVRLDGPAEAAQRPAAGPGLGPDGRRGAAWSAPAAPPPRRKKDTIVD